MKMSMEESKIDNYVITPRYIKSDYFEGKLTRPERNLLLWLRVCGDPYGIAVVTLDGLSQETFNQSCDKSYINKLLLSLKSKRYVWYSDRTGRRGSFEVHMGDWILPSKHLKKLDGYFEGDGDRGERVSGGVKESEVKSKLSTDSQSFRDDKNVAISDQGLKSVGDLLRGYDNDTYKENEKDNKSLESLSLNKKRDFRIEKFRPETIEESKCLDLARSIGDEEVGFYIGIFRKHGWGPLNRALREFKKSNGYEKDHPPSFFNSLVQLEIKSL
jgi:hypothetical protein